MTFDTKKLIILTQIQVLIIKFKGKKIVTYKNRRHICMYDDKEATLVIMENIDKQHIIDPVVDPLGPQYLNKVKDR